MEKTPDCLQDKKNISKTKSNLNKISNVKNKILGKLGSMISSGKQKVKQKLDQLKYNKGIHEREVNVKIQSIVKDKKENPTFTKVTKKEKREEDIFKIEEDTDGENFKVVIKDEDSDEEDDYIVVKKEFADSIGERKEKEENNVTEKINDEKEALKDITGIKKYINEDDYKIEEDEAFIQENQDIFTISHRLLNKGYLINVSEVFTVPFTRYENKSKILSMVGLHKDNTEVDYLCYFDEYYFYPIRNIPAQGDPLLRKIGERYDLRCIHNIAIRIIGKHYVITIDFLLGKYSLERASLVMYFTEFNARRFTEILNLYLSKLELEMVNEGEENQYMSTA